MIYTLYIIDMYYMCALTAVSACLYYIVYIICLCWLFICVCVFVGFFFVSSEKPRMKRLKFLTFFCFCALIPALSWKYNTVRVYVGCMIQETVTGIRRPWEAISTQETGDA